MRVIIAGGRDFDNYEMVCAVMEQIDATEIVCGGARGADSLGDRWAKAHHIPIKYFMADWDTNGRAAGIIRNHQMGDYADFLVAFWDGQSHGTRDMIEYMTQLGKHGKVVLYENHIGKK